MHESQGQAGRKTTLTLCTVCKRDRRWPVDFVHTSYAVCKDCWDNWIAGQPQNASLEPLARKDLLSALTDDELSALICACQTAEAMEDRGRHLRPPWAKAGRAAHKKLIAAEFVRADNAC